MAIDIDLLTVDQLAAMLAGAQRSCELCTGHGFVRDVEELLDSLTVPCVDCTGTGQVYIFPDVVREPCEDWKEGGVLVGHLQRNKTDSEWPIDPKECKCKGLSYVPSMSLEVWIRAIITLDKLRDHHGTLPSIEFDWNENTEKPFCTITCGHGPEYEAEGTLVLEALLRALVAWLEAQGVKLV